MYCTYIIDFSSTGTIFFKPTVAVYGSNNIIKFLTPRNVIKVYSTRLFYLSDNPSVRKYTMLGMAHYKCFFKGSYFPPKKCFFICRTTKAWVPLPPQDLGCSKPLPCKKIQSNFNLRIQYFQIISKNN